MVFGLLWVGVLGYVGFEEGVWVLYRVVELSLYVWYIVYYYRERGRYEVRGFSFYFGDLF